MPGAGRKLTVCVWRWLVRKQPLVTFETAKRTRFTTVVFICSDGRSFSPTTEPNEQAPLLRMPRPASAVTISAATCVAIGVRFGALGSKHLQRASNFIPTRGGARYNILTP